MYELLIHEELDHALNDNFLMHINGSTYCVTPHFSISGKESLLEQFAKLLRRYESETRYASE